MGKAKVRDKAGDGIVGGWRCNGAAEGHLRLLLLWL